MEHSYQDIEQLIKKFNSTPNKDDYNTINIWYINTIKQSNNEFLICVYLFLIGANIHQKYIPFTYEQHRQWIEQIRSLILNADSNLRPVRKTYLDFGLKAGYYK